MDDALYTHSQTTPGGPPLPALHTVEHATAGACGVHVPVQYVATVYNTVYTQAHIVYMYKQHGDT